MSRSLIREVILPSCFRVGSKSRERVARFCMWQINVLFCRTYSLHLYRYHRRGSDTKDSLVYMRASSKYLMRASPVFKAMLKRKVFKRPRLQCPFPSLL
jgi:hypothetical protein